MEFSVSVKMSNHSTLYIERETMELTKAENVFEVNKITYYFSKIINFHFLTIEKIKYGKYRVYTSKWDIVRFFISMSFYIWYFLDSFKTPLSITERSIIFDIGNMLNGKLQMLHPAISMVQIFCFRKEYFKIIENIHWIDRKVK